MNKPQNQSVFLTFLTAVKRICYPFWAFLQTEMRDFLTLSYASTSEIPILLYASSVQKVPLSGGTSP